MIEIGAADRGTTAPLEMTMDQAWRRLADDLDVDQHRELITSGDNEVVGTLLRRERSSALHSRAGVPRNRPDVDGRTE